MNLFHVGLMLLTGGLDVGFHVEYESFSFDPVIPDLLFKLDGNILYVEYESFSYEFDIHGSSDDGFCAEYESFAFDLIKSNLLFESRKSELIKSETIVIENFDLVQTAELLEITGLVDLGPSILPRSILHDDIISRRMMHSLADFAYVFMFSNWAQLFDKLKRTLTYASLTWWIYSLWIQLYTFYCLHVLESWSSMFNKMLRALMNCDLRSNVLFDMDG